MAKLGHPEGELNLVRAASTGGIMQGVSINASCSLEEMAEVRTEADRDWIFQIYLDRNRAVSRVCAGLSVKGPLADCPGLPCQNSEALVKKVEQMGFAAIMFTVDSAATGNRELDKRAKPVVRQAPGTVKVATQGVAQAISGYQDPDLSWDDVTWLKSLTKLPIIVKGLQTVADVELAVKYGAEAVILSNHGGRSLDFSPPPIDVLYELQQTKPELLSQVEVWIDGGVRRGTDVVKGQFPLLSVHQFETDADPACSVLQPSASEPRRSASAGRSFTATQPTVRMGPRRSSRVSVSQARCIMTGRD